MASFAVGGQFQCRACSKLFGTERGANYHARRWCSNNADDSKVDNGKNKDFDDDNELLGVSGEGGMELEGAVEEEDEESDTEKIKNFAPENFIRDHVNIPPIYNDAASTDPTLSGAFFHHQRLARTLKNRGQVPLTATGKASVELVALATRYNILSR